MKHRVDPEDWNPTDEEWSEHVLSILYVWLERVNVWLNENPDRRNDLADWDRHHVGGEIGTHHWPGWADCPYGPWPRPQRPHWPR